MIRCRTLSGIDTIAYTAMGRIGHMEHNENRTWEKDAKAFFESYGYEAAEHDDALRIYIDGMPCRFWMDEEGYHFFTPDGIEAIEPTWKCISALIVKYMIGEYAIEGDRGFHARMLAYESGFGVFFDAFEDFANAYKKAFSARVFGSNTIYADIQIGEKPLLLCLFSEKSWNVEIWLSGYHRYMSFDFNSTDDFKDAVKSVIADYFLNK